MNKRTLVGVPKAEIAKAGSVKPDQINICVGNKREQLNLNTEVLIPTLFASSLAENAKETPPNFYFFHTFIYIKAEKPKTRCDHEQLS